VLQTLQCMMQLHEHVNASTEIGERRTEVSTCNPSSNAAADGAAAAAEALPPYRALRTHSCARAMLRWQPWPCRYILASRSMALGSASRAFCTASAAASFSSSCSYHLAAADCSISQLLAALCRQLLDVSTCNVRAVRHSMLAMTTACAAQTTGSCSAPLALQQTTAAP
jgi:hypothetical protein